MKDLVPWGRSRAPQRYDDRAHADGFSPFHALRREMDRLFDDAFRGFGAPGFGFAGASGPRVEVIELFKEVRVTAELPGLEGDEVEVQIDDGELTISGENRSEMVDKDRRYGERYYGRLERRIALPVEVDEDRANATFRNGVLSVTLPKAERVRQKVKRIPISH